MRPHSAAAAPAGGQCTPRAIPARRSIATRVVPARGQPAPSVNVAPSAAFANSAPFFIGATQVAILASGPHGAPSFARRWHKRKKAAPKSGFPVKLVPRRGLEPPRLAALVPETSASTNSAIWAGRRIIAKALTSAKVFFASSGASFRRRAKGLPLTRDAGTSIPPSMCSHSTPARDSDRSCGRPAAVSVDPAPCGDCAQVIVGAAARTQVATCACSLHRASSSAPLKGAAFVRVNTAQKQKSRSEERLSRETGAQKRTRTSTPRGAST